MEDRPLSVVVVGAGFGGLEAARGLCGAAVRLTVVDRKNHYLFQPLLYQVATAALSPADIAYPIRSILRHQKNADVVLGEVIALDPENRRVTLRDGARLEYDVLVLAAGARHAYFGHEAWEPAAPGLKSLEDALEIRRRILLAFEEADRASDPAARRRLLTFAVVGGGPTGVELSGAIAEISRKVLVDDFRHIDPREARVVLLEAGPRLLPTYTERSSRNAEDALRRLGVETRTGSAVTGVDTDGVTLGSGERLEAATVLWAAGVAASPLSSFLGVPLDRNGRVLVAPDLTIPGRPEIFVIGDLAMLHQDGRPLPGVSPVAMQQGRYVARAIRGRLAGKPAGPFRYFDKGSLAVVGRSSAVADIAGLRLRGLPAWLVWCFVHILYLIGFRNRFVVMFEWAWSYLSYQRGARLITGDIDAPRPR